MHAPPAASTNCRTPFLLTTADVIASTSPEAMPPSSVNGRHRTSARGMRNRGAEPSKRVASARNAKERNAKCELSVNEASKAKGLLASVWTISSTRCEIVCGA